jgi:hypothetical protein
VLAEGADRSVPHGLGQAVVVRTNGPLPEDRLGPVLVPEFLRPLRHGDDGRRRVLVQFEPGDELKVRVRPPIEYAAVGHHVVKVDDAKPF